MIKATANTNVRAVLQHGGGLVNIQKPRAHARGRQLTSRGGVINRRCEATSIIPLPFPSSAAAVYPLTGVRRARKLSPSLRSNNRPHAQLVEGYKTLATASYSRNAGLCLSNKKDKRAINLLAADSKAGRTTNNSRMAGVLEYSPKLNDCFDHDRIGQPDQINAFNATEPLVERFQSHLHVRCRSISDGPEVIHKRVIHGSQPCGRLACPLTCDQEDHSLFIPKLSSLSPTLLGSNVHSDEYRAYRTNSLNPGSNTGGIPSSEDNKGKNHEQPHGNRWAEQVTSQQRAKCESDMHFLIQHDQLQASKSTLSLQAPRHHVQRGAV